MSEPLDISGTPLFPYPDERHALQMFLARILETSREAIREASVTPKMDLERLSADLSRFTFTRPVPLVELLPWVVRQLREGIVQITHPRYFGLFNPAPAFPAELGDHIVAAFNPQLAAARTAPAAVAIEAHVIAEIASRAGLPAGTAGHFTNNGSEANFTALIAALTTANPSFGIDGARAFPSPPVIYISEAAHLAWIKIAHLAGIGRSAVRQIATDGTGRLDVAVLSSALHADRAQGLTPVMIVATAGTTVGAMIDPIDACADLARAAGAWLHVDAAWGGAAIASDHLRGRLAGMDRADSITIDAHKWFATTMSCGMFLTAHPSALSACFGVSASFMPEEGAGMPDPYSHSVMWSRRFLGLRLFLNLAAAGWPGYARHVEHAVSLIDRLHLILAAAGWRIANPNALGVLCVEPPAGSPSVRSIVAAVLATGKAWVSAACFEGRDVVRICISNGQTNSADVKALADLLISAAGEKNQAPSSPERCLTRPVAAALPS